MYSNENFAYLKLYLRVWDVHFVALDTHELNCIAFIIIEISNCAETVWHFINCGTSISRCKMFTDRMTLKLPPLIFLIHVRGTGIVVNQITPPSWPANFILILLSLNSNNSMTGHEKIILRSIFPLFNTEFLGIVLGVLIPFLIA